ncbi:MAG: hypothetical protein KKD28_11765 [Chloroflexi bacterium]|nr:hypothetical protein [Chloroflexota bacterium]MBU1662134.1 hypothetical protein [Chloroflexota bacterium]
METATQIYTTQEVLTSLGYPDPLVAARQQARMILLGRMAHYQAALRRLENRWKCTLDDMRARYTAEGDEDFAADDDFLEWQWYADAMRIVENQLAVLAKS